jgi:hypothetical protein
MPWPLSTPGKDPVHILQEAGWAPGPVWTGVENLAPTGIESRWGRDCLMDDDNVSQYHILQADKFVMSPRM